jgi:hypothetical protein
VGERDQPSEGSTPCKDQLQLYLVNNQLDAVYTCGVTEKTATMKDNTSKATNEFVIASPIESDADESMSKRRSCLRRSKSPRGDTKTNPTAYLVTLVSFRARPFEMEFTRLGVM